MPLTVRLAGCKAESCKLTQNVQNFGSWLFWPKVLANLRLPLPFLQLIATTADSLA